MTKLVSSPLVSYLRSTVKNRDLVIQLSKREVASRYKGSYLGVLWSFIVPLFMLAIYTFVFSGVFHEKWNVGNQNKETFALVLFCGLTTFNVFSEVIVQAPSLIVRNPNYVKKVVFPLELLPVVSVIASLVNFSVGTAIVVVGTVVLLGSVHWTLVFLPLVIFPLLLLVAGLTWFLSSLGVFLRDVGQFITVVVQALMFLTPIFYPTTAFPQGLRFLFYFNPVGYVVDNMRLILIWGQYPNWAYILIGLLTSGLVAFAGALWFDRTRGGFADVL